VFYEILFLKSAQGHSAHRNNDMWRLPFQITSYPSCTYLLLQTPNEGRSNYHYFISACNNAAYHSSQNKLRQHPNLHRFFDVAWQKSHTISHPHTHINTRVAGGDSRRDDMLNYPGDVWFNEPPCVDHASH